jgi:hypothetical protein
MELNTIAILISAAALVVSVLSVIASYRVGRAQARVQERLLALEGARERGRLRESRMARLTARVKRYGTDYRLLIANEGHGPARRIRTQIDGRPLSDNPLVLPTQDEITELGPGAEAEYILIVSMGSPDVAIVEITWEDDSGEPGTWRSQLSL